MSALSPRLLEIVEALPLRPGMRVLEIGCGPGAMAREISARVGNGHVLAIDRSAKAIAQASATVGDASVARRLEFRQAKVEQFELLRGERAYDLAVAVRVGALDGRHPEDGQRAKQRLVAALTDQGRLFIDGGDPLREVSLEG